MMGRKIGAVLLKKSIALFGDVFNNTFAKRIDLLSYRPGGAVSELFSDSAPYLLAVQSLRKTS